MSLNHEMIRRVPVVHESLLGADFRRQSRPVIPIPLAPTPESETSGCWLITAAASDRLMRKPVLPDLFYKNNLAKTNYIKNKKLKKDFLWT